MQTGTNYPGDLVSRLEDCVRRGVLLNLAGDELSDDTIDAQVMRSWGEARTIPAVVIRDILSGRRAPQPDPHGLRLCGARIAGRLDLENVKTGVPLELTACYLPDGVVARDADLFELALVGCLIEQRDEPALDAERVHVKACLDLSKAVVSCDAAYGAVNLRWASIDSVLDCSRASVTNLSGPALRADGLRVGHDMRMTEFTAMPDSGDGAVRLPGAHVGGVVDCSGKVTNPSGTALLADALLVEHDLRLSGEFTTGEDDDGLGAVNLAGAHVKGQLDCRQARIQSRSGPALYADSLQVDLEARMDGEFEAHGFGPRGVVRLPGAHIGGRLRLDWSRIVNSSPFHANTRLFLEQLVYDGIPLVYEDNSVQSLDAEASRRKWLDLLACGTGGYRPQPYQQLASVYRAAGNDNDVREILIAQRDRELDPKVEGRWTARAWGKFTKVTLGYGYKPWRALIGLAATLVLAVLLCLVLPDALAHTGKTPTPGTGCTALEQVGVGLDLGVPLLTTGSRDLCDVTGSTSGQWLTVLMWVLQVAAWAFAALFIAGFTSAVRKT